MAENNSPSWWQTMPGILTGLAAIITAVTGLMIAFNRTSGRNDAVTPSSTSSPPPVSREVRPTSNPASVAPAGEIPLPEIRQVKLAGGAVVVTILSARSEPVDLEKRAVTFRIRFLNAGRYPALFVSSSYRLLVGDEVLPPTNLISEAVPNDSSKDGEFRFELPAAAKDVVLQISDGDNKSRIPLKLP